MRTVDNANAPVARADFQANNAGRVVEVRMVINCIEGK